MNVWAIELLVIVLLQARSLDAEVVRHLQRRKQLPLCWVVDPSPLVARPEIVRLSVRVCVEDCIFLWLLDNTRT